MNTPRLQIVRRLLLTALLACPLACVNARTAEDSFHFRNLSSEPPSEPVRQDSHPQLAVAGNLLHLAWLSLSEDGTDQRLMYRRSTDGGATFGTAQVLLSGTGSGFLYDGLNIQASETGQAPAYLAADGELVHLALLVQPAEGAPQIVYLRSTDGGTTFSTLQVLATVTLNPPMPAPGFGHTEALQPPLVAAAGGRAVIAFGYTRAEAVDTIYWGWAYGYYPELSVSWSDDGGASFQQSTLHGTPPTTRRATLGQVAIQGSEVLFAARDTSASSWGVVTTAVHAGVSTDGGANIHFRQLLPEWESAFGDTVRIVKHGEHVSVIYASEDGGEPVLGTLYQCRSTDSGDTWAAPQRLTEAPAQITNNSNFTVTHSGAEILVATHYFIEGITAGRVAVRRSTDNGANFSPWTTLADANDPGLAQLAPVQWPRFVLWPGAAGEARAALLWGGNFLVTSADSGASFGPARMVRPPAQVLPPTDTVPYLVAGADGTLHHTVPSISGTDINETDVYYRRYPVAPDPLVENQALTLGSNLPPAGDISTPRHRDSLQVGAAPNLTTGTAFTIEFWTRFQGDVADRQVFSSGAGSYGELALKTTTLGDTNRFQFELTTDAGHFQAIGSTVEPQTGQWYHLALRYDAARETGQMTLLIDGQPEATADAEGARRPEGQPFVFGNYHGAPDNDFTGEIDDIRFWNTAVPDNTILARHLARLTGDEPGLAAWFPLDGHTRDASGNLPDGMLSCRETFVPGVTFDSSPPVPSGLVSWWAADNDFRDRQRLNYAIGQDGVGFGAGMVRQAFLCDGVDDHVQVPSPTGLPLGAAPRTLMLWCRTPQDFLTSPNSALVQYGSDTDGQMFGLITSSNVPGKLYFFGYNADLAGDTALQPDTWYHVAVTYDGTMVRLFLNGQPDGSGAQSLNTVINGHGLTIGNRPGSNVWRGELDEVMLFDRALAPEEIATIHAAGTSGLYYDDEGPGGEPLAPPLGVESNGTDLDLTWPSENGFYYQLQVSTTLRADGWTDSGPPIPGNGGVLQATLLIGPEPAKFTRLKIVP